MDRWMDVKAVLRFPYSNQYILRINLLKKQDWLSPVLRNADNKLRLHIKKKL
jgi:hypothetical protein